CSAAGTNANAAGTRVPETKTRKSSLAMSRCIEYRAVGPTPTRGEKCCVKDRAVWGGLQMENLRPTSGDGSNVEGDVLLKSKREPQPLTSGTNPQLSE